MDFVRLPVSAVSITSGLHSGDCSNCGNTTTTTVAGEPADLQLPSGPSYYAARRALWLMPSTSARNDQPLPEQSTSRQKFEDLLSRGAYSEDSWRNGIENVWKSLIAGSHLKRRLPLATVIKIIHAGWLRQPEIWPSGAVPLESEVDYDEVAEPLEALS